MRGMVVLVLSCSLAAAASPSQADTLHNTLPALTFRGDFGSFGESYYRQYAAFTVPESADYYFTGLELALAHRRGPNDMFVGLFADDANYPTGTLLEIFRLTDLVQPLSQGGSLITLNSHLKPLLAANRKYWVGVWVNDELLTGMTWYHGQGTFLGPPGSRALYFGLSGWSFDQAIMAAQVRGDKKVDISVRPGSGTSSVSLSSRAIPVAVLGSGTFDATRIDPETVRLAGARIKTVGKKGNLQFHHEDVNGDSVPDFVCQVLTQELMAEPGLSTVFLEALTFDGGHIRGESSVYFLGN